ncbi:MAG: hypothetical protein QOE68_801 [Thermoanaerobaculia bacterium]|nr:hypothetical protein [Thermoanaerobaculia bacterium]
MVAGSPYNPVSMTKKVSESRASLPRPSRNELDEVFSSISPEASAFVSRNPVLRAKLVRAAERLGEAFPGHPLHLIVAFDHESGDRELFVDIERAAGSKANADDLMNFDRQWIRDREDPELQVNFNYHHR